MKVLLNLKFYIISLFILLSTHSFAQEYKVLESDLNHIKIEFDFTNKFEVMDEIINGIKFNIIKDDDTPLQNPGDPFLPNRFYKIGVPLNSNPEVRILELEQEVMKDRFIISTPDSSDQSFEELKYNSDTYGRNAFFPLEQAEINSQSIFRYIKLASLSISPFQFNPVERTLVFNKRIVLQVDFKSDQNISDLVLPVSDKMTEEMISYSLINPREASTFLGKIRSATQSPQENYWYDASKNYFKIYLKTKGIYRLSFEYLVSIGVPISGGVQSNSINIYNDGQSIPLDIVDNGDSIFNAGDYIDFVGYPPKPTPFTTSNIYNLNSVYWLSYQETTNPNRYLDKNGFPSNFTRTFYSTPHTLHFEKDSLYVRLGYAQNGNRDYWYWGTATAQNRQSTFAFEDLFEDFKDRNLDSNWITLKVQLHGMTNFYNCSTDHHADIKITDQLIGSIYWDGQKEATFNKRFYVSTDSIKIYPTGNRLNVFVYGDTCPDTLGLNSDDIRINWYEFEYERFHRVRGTSFNFKSPQNISGANRYWLWQWESDSMKILIPQKSEMIKNPQIINDVDKTVFFVDTVTNSTEYFCIAGESYNLPDSIIRDVPSDLRNISNGADYIIITHPKFSSIANQLAEFRQNNFPDENITNPRIKVVDIQQIYDEFSFGLLDPFALKSFVKYAFENWTSPVSPAPTYIVLVGDMSYDYRQLLSDSRPNFIPSLPYFARDYGQAASDNNIVSISGPNDYVPDLAIGRISIETVEEGNIILQKIINYPADNSKAWKHNVLLLASGLSYLDQLQLRFNEKTFDLKNNYVSPNGYRSSIVLNFPDTTKPEQEQYRGGGPKIREEINKGAALVNYYGHGGGYQWDLTFLDDDIYALENGSKLPMVLSVTCYTAHFDNQNVFGEQFNKVEGKGSIGFLGSSGLTYWSSGVSMNNLIFSNIFNQKNFIIGKVVLIAKNQLSPVGLNELQIALLTYLGDPLLKIALPTTPDFELVQDNLTINPKFPVLGDSVQVKLIINNLGTTFPNDSVVVELFAENSDTSYSVSSTKIPSFMLKDSVSFYWYPAAGGLYTLTAKVNETEIIEEIDHSDNTTSNNYFIFNISDPSILKPIDGFTSNDNEIEFIISDVGYYVDKQLNYFIEIDSSQEFDTPVKISGALTAFNSIVKWKVTDLNDNIYFWRARIYDGTQYGRWSEIRSFTLNLPNYNGYFAHEKTLKTFETYNVKYSKLTKSLVLNTDTLPARPSNLNIIEDIFPDPQLPDSLHLTSITTDGSYIYFANIWSSAGLNEGLSRIYRVGTGNDGTIKGQFYGPISTFRDSIKNSFTFHPDGNLYVAVGLANKLVRINVSSEIVDTIDVPPGLLRWDGTNTTAGPVYISSDGDYIYNITLIDSFGNHKYTVRTFDPLNGWSLAKPDIILDGSSFEIGFTGFFVHGGKIYPTEYYNNNYMRRYNLSDGFYEEEWIVMLPTPTNFQSYYSWCYDWENDNIYAAVYRASGFVPKFSRFPGYYTDANGSISTTPVGPSANWNYLKFDLEAPSPSNNSSASLLGYNSDTRFWDTIYVDIQDSVSLVDIDADKYYSLKLNFTLSDSTFTTTQPMELKSVYFNYRQLSDLYLERDDISFEKDSVLQGLPLITSIRAKKIGVESDSLFLKLKQDSTVYNFIVKANSDSISNSETFSLETSKLIFNNNISLSVSQNSNEYFYYNNQTSKSFYVIRDSTQPIFNISFDGRELIDGDIISSNPTVVMTLEDNSPLPLTPNLFTLQHNNIPLSFYNPTDSLKFEYIPYPNSKAVVIWTPKLEDGMHTLTVFAKDSSGNFFNSTAYTYRFNVFNNPDLLQVYNYPNPFSDNTYFTFELRGVLPPEEFKIKIFTVAGRLIREIIPTTPLQIGFNKIYWDGKDEDGDEIANGLYFYKIISKHNGEVKTTIQKLAKVK